MSYVQRRARLPEDTGIGLLFVGALGLGVILIPRGGSYFLYRPLLVLAFDERKAEVLGLRPRLTRLALVALAVVTSFRTVGSLLVFALFARDAVALLTSRTRVRRARHPAGRPGAAS